MACALDLDRIACTQTAIHERQDPSLACKTVRVPRKLMVRHLSQGILLGLLRVLCKVHLAHSENFILMHGVHLKYLHKNALIFYSLLLHHKFSPPLILVDTMTLASTLRFFGDSKITPSEDVLKCGNHALDKLLTVIKDKSKTPIARVAKNGSVGKKTAICIKVDYDCMFFIDQDVLPMERYNEFLDDLHDILTLNASGGEHIHQSTSALTYFYNGFYFDFLPAPYAKEAGPTAMVEEQLLYRIAHPLSAEGMDPYGGRCLGDQALAEGTVIFFKEQPAFVHCIARLLKWWSASVFVPGFFNGRSFRMEMFAVLAGQEEKNDDVLRGLRIALDKIRNYRQVHATFSRFYDPTSSPLVVSGHKPLLLDPANPRNNLLSPDVHEYFDKLASFAIVTLERLDASERLGQMLPGLFAPQPSVWSGLSQQPVEDSWIVGPRILPTEKQPRILAQKPYVDVRVLEAAAHVIGAVLVAKPGPLSQGDVQNAIDSVLLGRNQSWTPTSRRFEDMDALAIFPLHDCVGTCVLAGFNVTRRSPL